MISTLKIPMDFDLDTTDPIIEFNSDRTLLAVAQKDTITICTGKNKCAEFSCRIEHSSPVLMIEWVESELGKAFAVYSCDRKIHIYSQPSSSNDAPWKVIKKFNTESHLNLIDFKFSPAKYGLCIAILYETGQLVVHQFLGSLCFDNYETRWTLVFETSLEKFAASVSWIQPDNQSLDDPFFDEIGAQLAVTTVGQVCVCPFDCGGSCDSGILCQCEGYLCEVTIFSAELNWQIVQVLTLPKHESEFVNRVRIGVFRSSLFALFATTNRGFRIYDATTAKKRISGECLQTAPLTSDSVPADDTKNTEALDVDGGDDGLISHLMHTNHKVIELEEMGSYDKFQAGFKDILWHPIDNKLTLISTQGGIFYFQQNIHGPWKIYNALDSDTLVNLLNSA